MVERGERVHWKWLVLRSETPKTPPKNQTKAGAFTKAGLHQLPQPNLEPFRLKNVQVQNLTKEPKTSPVPFRDITSGRVLLCV